MARVSKDVSDDCSALAFYGFRPGARAVEGFYRTMVGWFGQLGHPPDKAGVTAPGFGSKLGSFERFNTKLEKTGFGKVGGVNLIATTPGAKDWGSDYYLTASYDDELLVATIVARSSLATLSAASLLPVAREVAEFLKPVYGIGFTRACELDPEGYSIGMVVDRDEPTDEELDEEARIAAWSETLFEDKVYRKGILRDLYPWNFLTKPHLAKMVNGVPLDEWIRQGTRRGTVGEFTAGMSFWEVARKDIPEIRQTLRAAGLILEPEEDEDEEPTEIRWTPEQSLAAMIGDQAPEDVIVYDSEGNEIPTEEVKKILNRGRKK